MITFRKSLDEDRTTIEAYENGAKVGTISFEILIEAYSYEFDDVFTEEQFDNLYPESDIVKVEYIDVINSYKNKGLGSRLMQRGMALMKSKGYTQFYLNASPMGFDGLGTMDLVNFYRKFGFRELLNQGHNVLMGITDGAVDGAVDGASDGASEGASEGISEGVSDSTIEIPNIPNTMNFWHGGNLDDYNDVIAQKSGRYEYGAGLYLTTHHDTAYSYSKGSRRLYLVTVEKGNDIEDSVLDIDKVTDFINEYVIGTKRKEILSRILRYRDNDTIKAHYFNNILLNEKGIKPSNTKYLRMFLVENGIDYSTVNNPFGWGETMLVLFNMRKIVKATIVKSTDKLTNDDYLLKNDGM